MQIPPVSKQHEKVVRLFSIKNILFNNGNSCNNFLCFFFFLKSDLTSIERAEERDLSIVLTWHWFEYSNRSRWTKVNDKKQFPMVKFGQVITKEARKIIVLLSWKHWKSSVTVWYKTSSNIGIEKIYYFGRIINLLIHCMKSLLVNATKIW